MSFTRPLETRRATQQFAKTISRQLQAGDFLILEGQLGAGKTFFTRALARGLGLPADVAVTSPTFALVHEYDATRIPFVHADLYRLGDGSEIRELGILPRIRGDAAVVIEWGKRFEDTLGEPDLEFFFSLAEKGRVVTVEVKTKRGEAIVSQALRSR